MRSFVLNIELVRFCIRVFSEEKSEINKTALYLNQTLAVMLKP